MHNTKLSQNEPWLSREELVEREHRARLRDYEDWPKRLEEICREAELRWWAAHPWMSSTATREAHVSPWCMTVPVRRLFL